jgi:hypothetical protein
MVLVLLRRLSLSTGFLNLDDLRNAPSGEEEGRFPFGDEVGEEEEEEDGRPPSGQKNGRPPSGEDEGRFMVKGDRKEAEGPLSVGGR